jgi:hypothetical protein
MTTLRPSRAFRFPATSLGHLSAPAVAATRCWLSARRFASAFPNGARRSSSCRGRWCPIATPWHRWPGDGRCPFGDTWTPASTSTVLSRWLRTLRSAARTGGCSSSVRPRAPSCADPSSIGSRGSRTSRSATRCLSMPCRWRRRLRHSCLTAAPRSQTP